MSQPDTQEILGGMRQGRGDHAQCGRGDVPALRRRLNILAMLPVPRWLVMQLLQLFCQFGE